MRDLSIISQSVVDPAVRPLVEEAIRAFNGGAHRSATVAAWIAVAVDLTNKIRSLAEGGDGEAKQRVVELNRATQQHDVRAFLLFESDLIEVAEKKLDLLDRQEAVHLRRLYEDRNLCAHPGFSVDGPFVPTVEAVRAHLVAAHDAVFSKHAVAGKRRQQRLTDELQGKSWPQPRGMADYLDSRFFHRASPATASNMTKLLIKSAIVPPAGCERPNLVAGRARRAAVARRNRDPQGFLDAITAVLTSWEDSGALGDASIVRVVGAFGTTSEFWDALPETVLERATTFISQADVEILVAERFFASGRPLRTALADTFDLRLADLDEDGLASVIKQTDDFSYLVPRLVELIGESDTFETAAKRMGLLPKVASGLDSVQIAALQSKIVNNPTDQIRPARDVEEALIDAFSAQGPMDAARLEAWKSLAGTLVATTDSKRYFGNHRTTPYGRFDEAVKAHSNVQDRVSA